MEKKTWKTGFQQLGNNVFCYITGGETMMSNCLMVVGEEYALVYDVLCTKGLTEEFLRECKKYCDKPIKYLVISHCHGDHFLGANALKDSIVIGHETIKEAFDKDLARGNRMEWLEKRYPHLDFEDATFPYPEIYLKNGCSIDLGGRTVEIKFMGKCHTEGDLILSIPDEKLMCMGDVLFSGVVPATLSGDLDNWEKVLADFENGTAEKFLPGHGPVCTKADLKLLREYFLAIKQQAQKIALGELTIKDETPSEIEMRMINEGWKETSRALFSTEQYVAKLRGETYCPDMDRVFSTEEKRVRNYS